MTSLEVTSFDELIDWSAVDSEGMSTASFPEDWLQGRTVFGGLTTAAALRLARQLMASEPERELRSVSATFMRPVAPGTVHGTARRLRSGKNVTLVESTILQDDHPALLLTASFGTARDVSVTVETPKRPERPGPDGLDELPYIVGVTPAATQHFAFRWTDGGIPFTAAQDAMLGGWCRHRSPATRGPEAVLALLDAWPPPLLPRYDRPVPMSTLTFTVHFLDVPEVTPEGWWWFRSETKSAAAGYLTFIGELYRPDGELAAWTEQLGTVFG